MLKAMAEHWTIGKNNGHSFIGYWSHLSCGSKEGSRTVCVMGLSTTSPMKGITTWEHQIPMGSSISPNYLYSYLQLPLRMLWWRKGEVHQYHSQHLHNQNKTVRVGKQAKVRLQLAAVLSSPDGYGSGNLLLPICQGSPQPQLPFIGKRKTKPYKPCLVWRLLEEPFKMAAIPPTSHTEKPRFS